MKIEGQEIVEVRKMYNSEMIEEGWNTGGSNPVVLILENGVKIFPSQDYEGNGPGCMFGNGEAGTKIRVLPFINNE